MRFFVAKSLNWPLFTNIQTHLGPNIEFFNIFWLIFELKNIYRGRIKEYADIVSSGEYDIPAEKAAEIWEAMDLLARSLKKSGFKKPRKTHPERVQDDQPSLPLAEPLQSSEKTK